MLWPRKEKGSGPGLLPPRRGGGLERPAVRASAAVRAASGAGFPFFRKSASCGGGGGAAELPPCSASKLAEAPGEGRSAAAAALPLSSRPVRLLFARCGRGSAAPAGRGGGASQGWRRGGDLGRPALRASKSAAAGAASGARFPFFRASASCGKEDAKEEEDEEGEDQEEEE